MKQEIDRLIDNIQSVIYVDRTKLEYIVAAMIAGGHVMLADTHGVGKTSLARALAGSIRWPEQMRTLEGVEISYFSRIQCTVDLLPQDILGFTRILGSEYQLIFNRGPIFSHFILCDEINLLTPKTQGSFFQAMEEKHVSIEGKTYSLPRLFFLISTMNLKGNHLFPLPAPQLDRFMIQISLGYPSAEDELNIVATHGSSNAWDNFAPVVSEEEILGWMNRVDEMELHPDVLDYIISLVRSTRSHRQIELGASPRTGVKLSRLARALAIVRGEDFVSIDTIKEIAVPAMAHRIECQDASLESADVIRDILATQSVDGKKSPRVSKQSGAAVRS
ncbi:AAA family ATPase [Salinispira pacifica]|uniref:MoxR-like ATPase n=1 Tax=Salinispira pacifica TaxID=1307761 RepID=V5WK04_9SPIO|nr:MoxR family ATPase [Salinispira pacifica]AHC15990.1 MoxR-like ATPase [Salinispira pacifica]